VKSRWRARGGARHPVYARRGVHDAHGKVAQVGGTLWFNCTWWPTARCRTSSSRAPVTPVSKRWSSRWTRRWPGREYNLRNGFTIPFRFTRRNVVDVLAHPRWLLGVLSRYIATTGMPRYRNFPAHMQTRITALPMEIIGDE